MPINGNKSRYIECNGRLYVAISGGGVNAKHVPRGRWIAQEVERHKGAALRGYNKGFRPVPRGRVPSGTYPTMAACHDAIRAFNDALPENRVGGREYGPGYMQGRGAA